MPRIVVDTNLLVSAFIARTEDSVPRRAFRLARERWRLCLSPEMEGELREVLSRPKFHRLGATPDAVALFLDMIGGIADRMMPLERVTDCRDPDDNLILEAALAAGAEVIVSGDLDLLALHPWRGIAILSPAAFLARFG